MGLIMFVTAIRRFLGQSADIGRRPAGVSSMPVPRTVLDAFRQPDCFVHLLQLLLFGDLVADREVGVLRLGRAGVVAHVQAGRGEHLAQPAVASRTSLGRRSTDAVSRLVDHLARVTGIFVERQSGPPGAQKRADSARSRPGERVAVSYTSAVATIFALACIAVSLLMFQIRAAFSPKTLRRISGVIFG